MAIRTIALPSRRRFLKTVTASTALSTFGGIALPYLSRAADRPLITHGIQSGDVSVDSGVVWARADRPSQMMVEVSTTESFALARALPRTVQADGAQYRAHRWRENARLSFAIATQQLAWPALPTIP